MESNERPTLKKKETERDDLTAKSETNVHCWIGWLYVGIVLTRLRLKVKPGWSGHMTMEESGEAGSSERRGFSVSAQVLNLR